MAHLASGVLNGIGSRSHQACQVSIKVLENGDLLESRSIFSPLLIYRYETSGPPRHCEPEAKQSSVWCADLGWNGPAALGAGTATQVPFHPTRVDAVGEQLDCFAALAMTRRSRLW
jgi:hypothetical protein